MAETLDDFWLENLERNLSDKRYQRRRDIVLRYVGRLIRADDYILNLGCGIGALSHFISQQFTDTKPVSLDMSSNSLQVGKEYYKLNLPVKADAIHLPFRDGTFEIVLMTEVIEHISEQEQLLSEANRVLKDGGYLIVTTSPIKSDLLYSLAYWVKGKELFGFSKRRVAKEHVAEQHPKQLKRNLERFGFEILSVKYWNVLHLLSIPQIMNIPGLSTFILAADNKLGFLSRLCTDIACVAKKRAHDNVEGA